MFVLWFLVWFGFYWLDIYRIGSPKNAADVESVETKPNQKP